LALFFEGRMAYWRIGWCFLDEMPASWLEACLGDTKCGVGIWFWEDFLYLFTIEFGIVESVFGRIESFKHYWSKFGSNGRKAATKIFISFKIGGDIKRRGMAIVEIVPIGMKIAHVIDYKAGKLHACCLNCYFSVMQQSKIRCW